MKIVRQQKLKDFPLLKVGENFNFLSQPSPFELTNAQKRVIKEIRHDCAKQSHVGAFTKLM